MSGTWQIEALCPLRCSCAVPYFGPYVLSWSGATVNSRVAFRLLQAKKMFLKNWVVQV